MLILIRAALIQGYRAQSIRWIILLAAALMGVAWLAANFSARQPATVAADVGISGIRTALTLMALFWVQELLSRDIDKKSLYFVLAYPIRRSTYLLSRFIAIALLLMAGLIIFGSALYVTVDLQPVHYQQARPIAMSAPFILSLFGIWLDLLVVSALAIWLATLSTTPFLPLLLGIMFAIASRMMGFTLDFLANSSNADEKQVFFLLPILKYAYWLLPDLSRMDWRDGVLYRLPPTNSHVILAMVVATSYCGMLIVMASWNLKRRQIA